MGVRSLFKGWRPFAVLIVVVMASASCGSASTDAVTGSNQAETGDASTTAGFSSPFFTQEEVDAALDEQTGLAQLLDSVAPFPTIPTPEGAVAPLLSVHFDREIQPSKSLDATFWVDAEGSVDELVDFYVASLESQGFTPSVSDFGGDEEGTLKTVGAQLPAMDRRPEGGLSITISSGGDWLEEGQASIAVNFRSSSFEPDDLLEGTASEPWIQSAESLLPLPDGAVLVQAQVGQGGSLTSSYRIDSAQSIDEAFADLHARAEQDGLVVGGSPSDGTFLVTDGASPAVSYELVGDGRYLKVKAGA